MNELISDRTIEERPWGSFQILYSDLTCKIKMITVKPGHKLSLQSHKQRDELWKHISGTGLVHYRSLKLVFDFSLSSITIKRETKHRIENNGKEDLKFIEIQTGDYFGEDDIIRYEDDYGRVK